MSTENTIGDQIRARRLKLKLTQAQLADQVRVSRSYIADIEGGRKSPSRDTLQPIVAALGGKVELVISWS